MLFKFITFEKNRKNININYCIQRIEHFYLTNTEHWLIVLYFMGIEHILCESITLSIFENKKIMGRLNKCTKQNFEIKIHIHMECY